MLLCRNFKEFNSLPFCRRIYQVPPPPPLTVPVRPNTPFFSRQAEDLNNKKPAAEGSGSAPAETAPAGAGAGAASPASSAMDTETPATASPASASATRAAAAAAVPGGVDEAKVTQLTAMGFSREQAEGALSSTGGDAEQAAGLLLAQMDL